MGPRGLAMYQDADHRWSHALTWVERRLWPCTEHNDRPKKGCTTCMHTAGPIVAVHVVRNDDGKILHERKRSDEVQFLEATGVKSTAAEFEEYLRQKLVANGGNLGAYEHLRVERPSVEAVVSPDKKADHDELYARAARVLKVPEADLRKRYGHLNPGLQAMNLRNRLRKAGRAV
jgi:hypothetical protein